jgi:hypothetical protein
MVAYACYPSYIGGLSRRIEIQASQPWHKPETLISKITKAKTGLADWLK